VPTTALDPALDATDVRSVTLVAQGGSGTAWVLDLSAVPDGPVPALQDQRLPTVAFDSLKVSEGDSPAVRDVAIPYTLSGPSGVDGRIRVVTTKISKNGFPVDGPSFDVTVPAGSATGSVALPVPANRIDDLTKTLTVLAYPLSGLMPSSWSADLRILDDDATPAFRTSVRVTPVTEGHSLVFDARLARPVGYWTSADAYPVRKGGTRLRIGDIEREFVKQWGLPDRMIRPRLLYAGQHYRSSCAVLPGRDHCVLLRLPIRDDSFTEGTERVTLRVRAVPRVRVDWVGGRVRDR